MGQYESDSPQFQGPFQYQSHIYQGSRDPALTLLSGEQDLIGIIEVHDPKLLVRKFSHFWLQQLVDTLATGNPCNFKGFLSPTPAPYFQCSHYGNGLCLSYSVKLFQLFKGKFPQFVQVVVHSGQNTFGKSDRAFIGTPRADQNSDQLRIRKYGIALVHQFFPWLIVIGPIFNGKGCRFFLHWLKIINSNSAFEDL